MLSLKVLLRLKDGKVAVVGLKIYEPSLNDDFVLDLKMRELDDGTWQLVEASNLKEYFTTLRKATQVFLKKYIDERAAAIKPYNDELNAKYPASKELTPDMYDDILAIYGKIDEAVEKSKYQKPQRNMLSWLMMVIHFRPSW